jgi:ferric-chelate reductase
MSSEIVTVSVDVLTITPLVPTPSQSLSATSSISASSASESVAPVGGISGGSSSGNSSQASGQAAQQGAEDEFEPGPLMYHVDLFLIGLIALFILLRAPRVLARLGRPSNWLKNGHILRSSTPQRPPLKMGGAGHTMTPEEKFERAIGSDESHTIATHEYWYTKSGQQVPSGTALPGGPAPSYPVHFSATPSFLRSLLQPLNWRPSPGLSLAQLIVCGIWLGATLYTAIYKSTGPFTDPVRWGWIAGAQLPFVFAFASKNNVISAMLGMGYEKLNFLHRFVATAVVASINIHALGYCKLFQSANHRHF